jgi:pimeloyl-ACP methyl ester carboxylesterase
MTIKQRMRPAIVAGVSLLISAVLCQTAAAAPVTHVALSDYAKPQTLVTVDGGRRINIRCAGQGSPTIVLTAGAGEQSLTWHAIQAALVRTTRVCAWDRAGFGFSDPSSAPQDVDHTTHDLQAALTGAGVNPPYLLVGHSLGGYETLMFAFRQPHDVAGIVLIDPSGPDQNVRLSQAAPEAYAAIDKLQQAQADGLKDCIRKMESPDTTARDSIARDCVTGPTKGYPPELNRALIRMDSSVANKKDYLSLAESFFGDTDSRELQQAWRSLDDMPLLVLTAGNPPPIPVTGLAKTQMPILQAEWSRMHDDMARLSARGENRVIPNTTHYIYVDRPTVALDAINEVLKATQPHPPQPG